MSWNLNSPCSVMTVWPALFPPWERMTMSALAARQSITLPLPSSPHLPPTRMITIGLPGLSCRLFGAGLGPPRLQVVEAGVIASEPELDGAGWTVAVLGHVDFGDPGFFVGFVVLGPEEEHHHVGVLLNRVV